MLLVSASVADVASIVTGLVTIALVCVTYVSVAFARDSAKAASASADLAAKQLQEAQRPVLIPGDPRQDDDDLVIAVQNIGIGPALRVFAVAQFRNQPAKVIGHFPEHVLPGVAAGGAVALRLRMRLEDLVQLKITYADVGDHSYTTEASWHRRLRRFTHTVVTEGDGVRVPVTIRISSPTEAPTGTARPAARQADVARVAESESTALTAGSGDPCELAWTDPRSTTAGPAPMTSSAAPHITHAPRERHGARGDGDRRDEGGRRAAGPARVCRHARAAVSRDRPDRSAAAGQWSAVEALGGRGRAS